MWGSRGWDSTIHRAIHDSAAAVGVTMALSINILGQVFSVFRLFLVGGFYLFFALEPLSVRGFRHFTSNLP